MRDLTSAEADLVDLATSSPSTHVSVAELVAHGVIEFEDIAALKAAGCPFYDCELPDGSTRVLVEAGALVRACAVVAEQRNAAEAPDRVH